MKYQGNKLKLVEFRIAKLAKMDVSMRMGWGVPMAKPQLRSDLAMLESDIIETLLAGHHKWRPDLLYPESHSDMQGAVRELLRFFEVHRRPAPIDLALHEAGRAALEDQS